MSTFTKARLTALHRLAKDNARLAGSSLGLPAKDAAYAVRFSNRYTGYLDVTRYLVTDFHALVCLTEQPDEFCAALSISSSLVEPFLERYDSAIALPVSITKAHLSQWSREEKEAAKADGAGVLLHLRSQETVLNGKTTFYEGYFNPKLVTTCVKAMGNNPDCYLIHNGTYSVLILRPADSFETGILDADFAVVMPVNPSKNSLNRKHILELEKLEVTA